MTIKSKKCTNAKLQQAIAEAHSQNPIGRHSSLQDHQMQMQPVRVYQTKQI